MAQRRIPRSQSFTNTASGEKAGTSGATTWSQKPTRRRHKGFKRASNWIYILSRETVYELPPRLDKRPPGVTSASSGERPSRFADLFSRRAASGGGKRSQFLFKLISANAEGRRLVCDRRDSLQRRHVFPKRGNLCRVGAGWSVCGCSARTCAVLQPTSTANDDEDASAARRIAALCPAAHEVHPRDHRKRRTMNGL
jgi:hypothetical protein